MDRGRGFRSRGAGRGAGPRRGRRRGRGGNFRGETSQLVNQSARNGSGNDSVETKTFPLGFIKIREMAQDIERGVIMDIDLVKRLTSDGSFYARLDILDPQPELELLGYLLTIVARASQISHSGLREMIHQFLDKVADSSLIRAICNEICYLSDPDFPMEKTHRELLKESLRKLTVILVEIHSKIPTHAMSLFQSYHTTWRSVKATMEGVEDADPNLYHKRLEEAYKLMLEKKGGESQKTEKPKRVNPRLAHIEQCEKEPPPQCFRDLPIFSMKQEVMDPTKPYLRRNKIEGAYENSDHYLDVQFRLLREDFIYEIREGINESGYGQRKVELKRYRGVKIGPPQIDPRNGEILRNVTFQGYRKIQWAVSKRLIYGSLLCFSSDKFNDELFFGVVCNRDPNDLSKGLIQITFDPSQHLNISFDKEYEMAESNAYFEAYRHVLAGLQAIRPEDMPFEKYLVYCETDVDIPKYLGKGDFMVDFSPLIADSSFSKRVNYKRNILNPEAWPSTKELGLDVAQMDALRVCLTKELSIVQGPPGTGKTYIGLQLTKLLLDPANMPLWNTPINEDRPLYEPRGRRNKQLYPKKVLACPLLVVCFTNHALDQFLEGIAQFMDSGIIRVGGRCKSELLQKFGIQEARMARGKPFMSADLRQNLDNKRKAEEQIVKISTILENAKTYLLSFRALVEFIPPKAVAVFRDEGSRRWDDDFEICRWLRHERRDGKALNDPKRLNLLFIKELMNDHGIPESSARVALEATGNIDVWKAFDWFSNPAHTTERALEGPIAAQWPKLEQICVLALETDVPEDVALEALNHSNNQPNEAKNWLATVFGLKLQPENGEEKGKTFYDGAKDFPGEREREVVDDNWLDELSGCNVSYSKDNRKGAEDRRRAIQAVNMEFFTRLDHGMRNGMMPASWALFQRGVLSAVPMSEREEQRVTNVWNLPLSQRRHLFMTWTRRFLVRSKNSLDKAEEEFCRATKLVQEQRQLMDIDILGKAKVVGMTTSGAAKYQTALQVIKPKIVIMEEAAEVLEAHLVTSLSTGCQHVILIGDHQQLRPNPSVYELAKKFNLEISLFERLIKNDFPYAQLQLQHRMRPEISRALMPHFYPNLRDDKSVQQYKDVPGMTKNLFFFNHPAHEKNEGDSKSHKNIKEAEYAAALAQYLVHQEISPSSITILGAYSAQYIEMKSRMQEINRDVKVEIVDNFQGEENDIIILSLVRSNSEQKIGFLGIDNRVCVALSRAKKGLYVFGNFDLLSMKSDLWRKITTSLEDGDFIGRSLEIQCQIHETISTIKEPKDFRNKAPEGGCLEFCNIRMDCGHTCEKRCHPYDADHKAVSCSKPCRRLCEAKLHLCKKICSKPCGKCKFVVKKSLGCGHEQDSQCYLPTSEIRCKKQCNHILPCGHQCQNPCSQDHTQNCTIKVTKLLSCGHKILASCSRNSCDISCRVKTIKKWPCGHMIETECCVNVNSAPCPFPCGIPLPECEHPCSGTCGSCRFGRLHHRCVKKCNRVLLCGHECVEDCSKVCPPCRRKCETACAHNSCGGGKNGRKCGIFCPPCNEPCAWQCRHSVCTQLCYLPCDRPRCLEPCGKEIQCKKKKGSEPHVRKCIGVCGELCPDVCQQCEPKRWEEITTVFFGPEDEPDTLFLQMDDCKNCILPVESVDSWVDAKKAEAEFSTLITCPKCLTPIRKCMRYGPEVKARLNDIQTAKLKIQGRTRDLERRRSDLLEKVDKIHTAFRDRLIELKVTMKGTEQTESGVIGNLMREKMEKVQQHQLSNEMIHRLGDIVNLWQKLCEIEAEFLGFFLKPGQYAGSVPTQLPWIAAHLKKHYHYTSNTRSAIIITRLMKKELEFMRQWIEKHLTDASEFMLTQFSAELMRLDAFAKTSRLLQSFFVAVVDKSIGPVMMEMHENHLYEILCYFSSGKPFEGEVEKRVTRNIEKLITQYGNGWGISKLEKVTIIRAMNFGHGHWYKCPNGHLYCIGECGQAMEESRCPECGAEVGGQRHRLLDSNAVATELEDFRID